MTSCLPPSRPILSRKKSKLLLAVRVAEVMTTGWKTLNTWLFIVEDMSRGVAASFTLLSPLSAQ